MFIKQFYLNCLAHASYMIGDERAKVAAVVDPQRDVDQYVAFALERGLRISHVLLTHLHADFLAGHLELRNRAAATICLGAGARAEYPFEPMTDDSTVDLGRVRLRAMATPGHTPESISLLVFDLDASEKRPRAVLTGDTLFVGDVGRPDLRGTLGWSAEALGSLLYDSLHTKLLSVPDDTLVYPAHGAGSLCGKALGKETFSTIGEQRRFNYALQPMSREAFVELVTADQPDAPAYFTYDAVLNAKDRPTLEQALAGFRAMSLDEVLASQRDGAQVVDTRDPAEYAACHLVGSLNIGLGGEYATWAGTILTPESPIVIIAEPGRERESAMRLGRIGFDRVPGYLEDPRTLDSRPELNVSTERLSPAVAAERLVSNAPPQLVDVRRPTEYGAGHIQGSLSIPLNRLTEPSVALVRDVPVLVHCAGGYRSSIAASLLQRQGFSRVGEIAGGLAAWEAAGLPVHIEPKERAPRQ